MSISYGWRAPFTNPEVEGLHGDAFDHPPVPDVDWRAQLDGHSLGWVCARADRRLIGFVNVAWDGSRHAFVLDTVVTADHRRSSVGTRLVAVAARGATAAGCEWLHVDFEEHLESFYIDACRFGPTRAGLLRLTATPRRQAGRHG